MSQTHLIYSNAEDYELRNESLNVSYVIDRTPDYSYNYSPRSVAEQRLEEVIINLEDNFAYRRILVFPFTSRFSEEDPEQSLTIIAGNTDEPDYTRRMLDEIERFDTAMSDDEFISFESSSVLTRKQFAVVEPFEVCVDRSCCVCLEENEDDNFAKLNCDHIFCVVCVAKVMSTSRMCCPLCRENITRVAVQTEEHVPRFDIEIEDDEFIPFDPTSILNMVD